MKSLVRARHPRSFLLSTKVVTYTAFDCNTRRVFQGALKLCGDRTAGGLAAPPCGHPAGRRTKSSRRPRSVTLCPRSARGAPAPLGFETVGESDRLQPRLREVLLSRPPPGAMEKAAQKSRNGNWGEGDAPGSKPPPFSPL